MILDTGCWIQDENECSYQASSIRYPASQCFVVRRYLLFNHQSLKVSAKLFVQPFEMHLFCFFLRLCPKPYF